MFFEAVLKWMRLKQYYDHVLTSSISSSSSSITTVEHEAEIQKCLYPNSSIDEAFGKPHERYVFIIVTSLVEFLVYIIGILIIVWLNLNRTIKPTTPGNKYTLIK